MDALRPLGVLHLMEKSSDTEPLLQALAAAGALADNPGRVAAD